MNFGQPRSQGAYRVQMGVLSPAHQLRLTIIAFGPKGGVTVPGWSIAFHSDVFNLPSRSKKYSIPQKLNVRSVYPKNSEGMVSCFCHWQVSRKCGMNPKKTEG